MITRSRSSLPLTGLRSIHTARTRIYAAGSDPLFSRNSPRRTIQVAPAFPDDPAANDLKAPLWRPDVIDRLQSTLSRRPE